MKTINWIETHINEPLHHDYDLIQNEAYRSILKTAVNFFILKGGLSKDIAYALYCLAGQSAINNVIRYYYPEAAEKLLSQQEISHKIYLKADPQTRLCYCYIEPFAVHCFAVILSRAYNGPYIENCYQYDLTSNTEIQTKFEIPISREEIDAFEYPGDKTTETAYFGRLERVYKLKGIKMEITPRNKIK